MKKVKTQAISAFRHYIEGDVESYCRQGLDILKTVASPCEKKALEDF